MTHQEGWLNQLVLNKFVEEQVQDVALEVALFVLNLVLFCNSAGFLQSVDFVKVNAGVFLNSFYHGDASERFAQVNFLVAIDNGGGS